MQNTSIGWTYDQLSKLLVGFGFIKSEGGEHTKYAHQAFPVVLVVIPRHHKVKRVYIEKALEAIELVERLQMEAGRDS